jgi:hypothetical protein
MKRLISTLALCATLFFIGDVCAIDIDAVASIKSLDGDVKVNRQNRTIVVRRGLVLNDKDVVITATNAKTTILFRDGSEIRLFQNSRFIIESTEEREGPHRSFINRFRLQIGSLWGHFAQNRQTTTIHTPTATCGIKGTSVSIEQKDSELNVSLFTGAVELENEDEKILIGPGKMVEGITKQGSFKDKIVDIPFKILISPDRRRIEIPTAPDEGEISFTLQLIDVRTKSNLERSANIYLTAPTDKIVFPESVQLNRRGYERVTARILPFMEADYKDGQIDIIAIVDGEDALKIGQGVAVLTYDLPRPAQRTIRIDATSGMVQP